MYLSRCRRACVYNVEQSGKGFLLLSQTKPRIKNAAKVKSLRRQLCIATVSHSSSKQNKNVGQFENRFRLRNKYDYKGSNSYFQNANSPNLSVFFASLALCYHSNPAVCEQDKQAKPEVEPKHVNNEDGNMNNPPRAPQQRRRWLRFWYSSAGPRSSGVKNNSMFTSRELEDGLKRREKREEEIQWFRQQVQNRVQLLHARRNRDEITEEQFQMELHILKKEVLLRAQKILYGVDEPGARQRYLEKYGCCAWTDEAMKEISTHGKIIEIGAGGGQWQNELSSKWKVDIVAFDNEEQIPVPGNKVGVVRKGDEQVILHYPERTLMLVYPPPGDMALNCLKYYKGDTLIYVGEGKGGCNGNDQFFQELCAQWIIEKEISLDNFPECFEKLYILKRK